MNCNKNAEDSSFAKYSCKVDASCDYDLVLKIIAFCLKEGKVAARQIAREFKISRKRATQIVRLLESRNICLKSDKKNTPCQFPCSVTVLGTECQTTPLTAEPDDSIKELSFNLNEIIKENKSPYSDKDWNNVLNVTPTGYYDDVAYYLSELIDNFNERSTYQRNQGRRKTTKDFFKESGMFRRNAFSGKYEPILFYKFFFKRVPLYIEETGNKFSIGYDYKIKTKHFQWVMRKIIKTFLVEK